MEIYFADSNNRFLTVTGNIINTQELLREQSAANLTVNVSADNEVTADAATVPSGMITKEALKEFLDSFMKRPMAKVAQIQLPEGGSILSDEEILNKAKHGKNGERFAALYEGD